MGNVVGGLIILGGCYFAYRAYQQDNATIMWLSLVGSSALGALFRSMLK